MTEAAGRNSHALLGAGGIAAVNAAYSSGADGVEVDLRLTADGVLALSHDADLRRLTGLRMG